MTGPVGILDGGMSRELMRLGAPFRQPEWTALALLESPDHVRRAHAEFALAGAEVLTTNAYAVVPFHLGDERFERDGRWLAALSARLARAVADEFGRRVAGCLPPPLGSFRPDLFEADRARQILEVLVAGQAAHVDLWLVETASSIAEVVVALDVVGGSGSVAPVWASFTVDDADGSRLRSGEPVVDAVHAAEAAGAAAVAVNCSPPEVLTEAVRAARSATDLPIGVYANVLHHHSAEGANEVVHEVRDDASPRAYGEWAERWVEAGATLVGGCCGTTAEHVAELAARFGSR